MKWIKITKENRPKINTMICFLVDDGWDKFPDNVYTGIRDSYDIYYPNRLRFEYELKRVSADKVTHYFYITKNGALAK